MPEVLNKIEFTRSLCRKLHIGEGGKTFSNEAEANIPYPPFAIQVDGGINDQTAAQCIAAGANHLVAGTYLFHGNALQEKIGLLRNSHKFQP